MAPAPQSVQVAPVLPQAESPLPGWQVPLCVHPVQQTPLRQVPAPLLQLPPVTGLVPQAPPAQVAVWQVPTGQGITQVAPPEPHLAGEVPSAHDAPSQQPVQQLPLRHCPPVQAVVSPLLPMRQELDEQSAVRHSFDVEQPVHGAPLLPQLVLLLPAWQANGPLV